MISVIQEKNRNVCRKELRENKNPNYINSDFYPPRLWDLGNFFKKVPIIRIPFSPHFLQLPY